MEKSAVRKCVDTLLARREPGLLVPSGPWDKALQSEIEAFKPADNASQSAKSGLLLWNDDLTGCHEIAQELPDEFGAYLHGVMHRREPDYGNSKYWFRRVGEHALFPELRAAAIDVGKSAAKPSSELQKLIEELAKSKTWDAFRMVDWCEQAGEEDTVSLLRAVQALEIQGLTSLWLSRAGFSRS